MNVVDSSAWLEYFGNGPNAGLFAAALEDVPQLVVPSITLLEVFKRMHQQHGVEPAKEAVAAMCKGSVIALDARIAIFAAQLGLDHRLPAADSVILATARLHDAVLWTQDKDFEGIEGVRYFAPKR